jgi:predicted nucleic acid-binding protein
MRPGALIDTGPLVAYLSERERYHGWAVETFSELEPPFITCEPVLSEACFVIARNRLSPEGVLDPVARGMIQVGLHIGDEARTLASLMQRYANVPMSLADACLVRLAEMTDLPICTLDRDFAIYRANRRRPLTLITPPSGRSLHEP